MAPALVPTHPANSGQQPAPLHNLHDTDIGDAFYTAAFENKISELRCHQEMLLVDPRPGLFSVRM